MRMNVIGKSNGVGLSRDLVLMADALRACGCEVAVLAVDSRTSHRRRSRLIQWQVTGRLWRQRITGKPLPTVDANIMMEHLWPESLPQARLNVAVPNPEWFDRHDLRSLKRIDRVWAKTDNTRKIFQHLGCAVSTIGFDSEDRLDTNVARERSFFHLAGKSTMKGTDRLVKVWRAHPKWPRLIVVRSEAPPADWRADNIDYRTGYMADAELRRLQNQSTFHLCPSLCEGWGHYLVEAMSVGAVTITVDAPPMNEFIVPGRGLHAAFARTYIQKQATCYVVDEAALSLAIEQAMSMSAEEIAACGAAARAWYVDNKHGFVQRLQQAIKEC